MFPADNADFRKKKSAQTSLASLAGQAGSPRCSSGEAGRRAGLREIVFLSLKMDDFMDRHYLKHAQKANNQGIMPSLARAQDSRIPDLQHPCLARLAAKRAITIAYTGGKAGSKNYENCPKDSFGENFLFFGTINK